jgi:hypothetical protein
MPFKNPETRRARQRIYAAQMRLDPERYAHHLAMKRAYIKAKPEVHREAIKRHARNRRRMLDEIKVSRGCIDCGYNAAPEALHFDHRDPEQKLFIIAWNLARNLPDLMAEIAKCEVRCANCHAIRTKREQHNRRSYPNRGAA